MLQQVGGGLQVAIVTGDVERGVAGLGLGVDLGVVVKQHGNRLHLVLLGRQMEWGQSILQEGGGKSLLLLLFSHLNNKTRWEAYLNDQTKLWL